MSIDTRKPGSSMDTKQKAIIGIMVIVVIIVIWQVIGLFGGGSSSSPPAVKPAAGEPNPAVSPAGPNMTGALPPSQRPQMAKPQVAPVQNNSEIFKIQKDSEEKYLTNVNQLQMLKLQQQIAETNQAIASAKLATVTSEKSIADLLTKPAPPIISESEYASKMTSGPPAPTVGAPTAAVTTTITVTVKPDTNYTVLSVAQQGSKWSAIVGGANAKLYNVKIGDTLNDDGSKVVSINRSSVVLEKDGKKRKINLSSAI